MSESKALGCQPLIKRVFKSNETSDDSQLKPIRVLQWNILADALSDSSPDRNFCKVPVECLDWSYRKHRIVEQILSLTPDLVCLQEVELGHYEGTLEPALKQAGFVGVFNPKLSSPCLLNPRNSGPDGQAMFYRASRFRLRKSVLCDLKNEFGENSSPFVCLFLVEVTTGQELICCCLHLKAKRGYEQRRLAEVKDALAVLKEHAQESSAVVVCGDFNGEPGEPCYVAVESFAKPNLASVYKCVLGEEPDYTTWKIRPELEEKRTIDYIWYTPAFLRVARVLMCPADEDVPSHRFPSYDQPSDHVCLCCDLAFHPDGNTTT